MAINKVEGQTLITSVSFYLPQSFHMASSTPRFHIVVQYPHAEELNTESSTAQRSKSVIYHEILRGSQMTERLLRRTSGRRDGS